MSVSDYHLIGGVIQLQSLLWETDYSNLANKTIGWRVLSTVCIYQFLYVPPYIKDAAH